MAPVLNNLEQLIRMPWGCGEQNMVTFVPDIVVSEYLNVTQRLTPQIGDKAQRYIESGASWLCLLYLRHLSLSFRLSETIELSKKR